MARLSAFGYLESLVSLLLASIVLMGVYTLLVQSMVIQQQSIHKTENHFEQQNDLERAFYS